MKNADTFFLGLILLIVASLAVLGIWAIPGEWLTPAVGRGLDYKALPFGTGTIPIAPVVSFS